MNVGDNIYQLTDDEAVEDLKASVKKLGEIYADATPPQLGEVHVDATSPQPAGAPTPYYWQLVDLARDLCRAAGYDPDQRVLDTQNAQRGPLGSTLVSATVPAWTLYIDAAENVKGALNADA